MKIIILLSMLFSLNSFACLTYEAQFVSTVKEVTSNPHDPNTCYLKLDINLAQAGQSWQMHQNCPLSPGQVVGKNILTSRCHLQVGESVGGYLVESSIGLILE